MRTILTAMQIFSRIVFFLWALSMLAHSFDRFGVFQDSVLKRYNPVSIESSSMINAGGVPLPPVLGANFRSQSSSYNWMFH